MKKTTSFWACFRPLDGVICLFVLLLAVLLLCLPLLRGAGTELSVTVGGETSVYSLAEDRELTLSNEGYTLYVCIANGEAWVAETDCPEEVCRRTGRISHAGESILCSRANILLAVLGEGGYDAVVG